MNLQDLVASHLSGDLDEEGRKRLNAILQKNPAARSIFASALRQEVLLAEILREGKAEAAPARRRFPWKPLAAAAAVLLAAGAAWWFRPPAPPAAPIARLERAEGTVWIVMPSGRARAAAGTEIVPGARIEADGPAAVRFGDGVRVRLDPGTQAALPSADRVVVDRGSVAAEVSPRSAGRPFVVATPQAEALVLGTRFIVSIEGEGTLLKVNEGRVRMKRASDAASAVVSADQFAVAAPGVPLEPLPLARTPPPERCPATGFLPPAKDEVRYRLKEGAIFYRDRGYEISTVPPPLRGHWGITTFQEDMQVSDEERLSFQAAESVDVYIGYDFRAMRPLPRLPRWMQGYRDTGMRIFSQTAGDTTFHVYRKRHPAGRIALGGNHHGGDTGARENYIVIVTPEGAIR